MKSPLAKPTPTVRSPVTALIDNAAALAASLVAEELVPSAE